MILTCGPFLVTLLTGLGHAGRHLLPTYCSPVMFVGELDVISHDKGSGSDTNVGLGIEGL